MWSSYILYCLQLSSLIWYKICWNQVILFFLICDFCICNISSQGVAVFISFFVSAVFHEVLHLLFWTTEWIFFFRFICSLIYFTVLWLDILVVKAFSSTSSVYSVMFLPKFSSKFTRLYCCRNTFEFTHECALDSWN